MIFKVAIFCFAIFHLACGQMKPSENYTHSATLISGKIELYWKFDEIYIIFEVIGQTTGWIGIGFSPNGAMTGADMMVGWVKNGNVTITDRHGTGNVFPPIDPEQNIDILGGTELNGWTMFKFSRQLAACEASYDREITQATQRLIFAYGDSDPSGDDITVADYHSSNRGVESMYFLQSSNTQSSLPEDATYETFDVVNDNFEIPAEDTYYNCRIVKVPTLASKHHIVKVEPVIQAGNEVHVHHILIFSCESDALDETEIGIHKSCITPTQKQFRPCSDLVTGWAIGGKGSNYPPEAGISIGETNDTVYFLMEMHYDNPKKESGIIDSSGMRFTYTSSVRKYDVGTVTFGQTGLWRSHLIPPRTSDFLTVTQCNTRCIEEGLTAGGVENITMFGVTLHSHLTGKALQLRHIREGKELPFVASDPSYDFNYQDSIMLDPYVSLEKHDELQLECVFNTEDRDYVTQGGLGTRNEMCLGYVSYFPKLVWRQCTSFVQFDRTAYYLNIDPNNLELIEGEDSNYYSSYTITAPPGIAGMTLLEYFNEYNWTAEKVKQYETFYNQAQHVQACISGNKESSKIYPIAPINITFPYVKPRKTCLIESSTPSSVSTTATETTTSGDESRKTCLIESSTPSSVSTTATETTTSGDESQRGRLTVVIAFLTLSMFFK